MTIASNQRLASIDAHAAYSTQIYPLIAINLRKKSENKTVADDFDVVVQLFYLFVSGKPKAGLDRIIGETHTQA